MVSTVTRREFLSTAGKALGIGLVAGSPLLLDACSSSAHTAAAGNASKSAVTSLPFAYQPGYDYGLYYVANEMGFLGSSHLQLQPMTIFSEGTAEVDALLAGKFAAAAVGFTPVLSLAAKGEPLKVIDIVANGARNYTLVAQSSIKSVPDLKGKTVGVTLGTNYEYFLDQVLAKFGLTESDLHVVNLQPPAAQAAFVAGRLDATVPVTVNNEAILAQRPGAQALFTASDFTKPPRPSASPFAIYDLVVATESSARSNQAMLQNLSKVFHSEITDLVSGQPGKAAQAIYSWQQNVVKAQVTLAQIQQGLAGYDFYTSSQAHQLMAGGELAQFLKTIGSYLASKGLISSVPDPSRLIDPGLVPA